MPRLLTYSHTIKWFHLCSTHCICKGDIYERKLNGARVTPLKHNTDEIISWFSPVEHLNPLIRWHHFTPHPHTPTPKGRAKSKFNSKICKICVRVKQKCIYSSWKESILMSSSSPARVSTLCCAALWLFGQWNNLIHQCLYTRIPQMQFSKWPPAHIGTWVSYPTVILAPRQSLLCRLKI